MYTYHIIYIKIAYVDHFSNTSDTFTVKRRFNHHPVH